MNIETSGNSVTVVTCCTVHMYSSATLTDRDFTSLTGRPYPPPPSSWKTFCDKSVIFINIHVCSINKCVAYAYSLKKDA